jgi:hypothetical protein
MEGIVRMETGQYPNAWVDNLQAEYGDDNAFLI